MKEIIAHQVRLESYRHKESTTSGNSQGIQTPESTNESVPREKEIRSDISLTKNNSRKLSDVAASAPTPKRPKTSLADTSAKNFLGVGAKRARLLKSARKAAAVGLGSKKNQMAHTGSGFRLNQVIRLRYVKGFTQAVRTPCRQEEIL